jgi:hypothetical protein
MQHCPEPGGPARRSATTRRDHRPPRRRRACRRRASGPRQTSSTTDLRLAPDAPSQHHVSTVDAALRVPRIGERGTCAAVHTGAGGLGTSRPRRGASTARGNGASAATGNGTVGNSRRHAIGVRSLSRVRIASACRRHHQACLRRSARRHPQESLPPHAALPHRSDRRRWISGAGARCAR